MVSNRIKRERERKANEITDAAEKCFFKKGYDKTTMDEIAAQLELTKTAIYRYFENKEELYFSVAVRGVKILNKMMIEEFSSQNNGREKILKTCYAFKKFYKQFPDYCQVLTEAHDRDPNSLDTPHIQELIKIDQQNLGIICDAIDIGKKDGSIREDINTFLTALYLVKSTLNIFSSSLSTIYYLGLFEMSKEDLIEHSLDLMIHSISK
ncbi:TetR/AcrR family transcriptional regulator [Methanobacterium formicicum]|uniref:HTH tetR-type domain-containing protein n=1 Tax=Methanobacterium formicicum TaxID=2162 RepID=A0A090I6F6_METFO|nr:TetR/AcrR family transcriptional regulator [Methanobacterium formicicum]MDH2658663.1 TetR/AcrR family transcriptional regulator [Methanobacterium formicicum]CEA13710.1 hypothetical protein DSM1535_1376 [Methanobacterium formicicum]